VDVLSGFNSQPADSQGAAAVGMMIRLAGGSRTRDHETALQKILSLSEQIFRSWAMLSLDLNYYKAPTNCDNIWSKADDAWRGAAPGTTPLAKAEPGKQFPSFSCFAYFCFTFHELKCPEIPILEKDLADLQSCLSFFNKRNDSAYAVSSVDEKTRNKYFNIANRWIDPFCAASTKYSSRHKLNSIIEPLPLIDEDGRITG